MHRSVPIITKGGYQFEKKLGGRNMEGVGGRDMGGLERGQEWKK